MNLFFAKHGKRILLILTTIIAVSMIFSAIFMLSYYKEEITERAASIALYNVTSSRSKVETEINSYVVKTAKIASDFNSSITDEYDLKELIKSESKVPEGTEDIYAIKFIRYYKNNVLYSDTCDELEADITYNYMISNPTVAGYVGSYNYEIDSAVQPVICFYCPVDNCPLVDSICVYYARQKLETFYDNFERNEFAEFSILATNIGSIIVGDELKNPNLLNGQVLTIGNIVDVCSNAFLDQSISENLDELLETGQDGVVVCDIGTSKYVFAVGAQSRAIGDLAIIELYKVDTLCANGINTIYTIIAVLVLFTILAIVVIIYFIVSNKSIKRKLDNSDENDTVLNCFNRYGFEQEVDKIINEVSKNNYDIVVFTINHYKRLSEQLNEYFITNLLKYVNKNIYHFLKEEETYGYLGDGNFAILINVSTQEALIDRLKVLAYTISQYKSPIKLDLTLTNGVYELFEEDQAKPEQMIDFAFEAISTSLNIKSDKAGNRYCFYDTESRKIRIINEDMELHMEGALKDGEFQVFYQPKYNLNKNIQDGAEALVRWYDKKNNVYNRPALFMALFEQNGFITKLDRYVFTRVCEYINYSVMKGRPIYPISVNISRVTAMQPDFIDYYVKTKKQYGVRDGLLMIEFTETFAYENYDTFSNIVSQLHENGFQCSIDDFGCGYSSYKLLKSLPMDEIKLDRFFMDKGLSQERDDKVFNSIIKLAKDLNMKVTQEGVETKEGVERLRNLGCDVIQGYFYSHPLPLSDYLNFVQRSKEHNI